jgi:hypothetical protein
MTSAPTDDTHQWMYRMFFFEKMVSRSIVQHSNSRYRRDHNTYDIFSLASLVFPTPPSPAAAATTKTATTTPTTTATRTATTTTTATTTITAPIPIISDDNNAENVGENVDAMNNDGNDNIKIPALPPAVNNAQHMCTAESTNQRKGSFQASETQKILQEPTFST